VKIPFALSLSKDDVIANEVCWHMGDMLMRIAKARVIKCEA
jgi:hypothetical protein